MQCSAFGAFLWVFFSFSLFLASSGFVVSKNVEITPDEDEIRNFHLGLNRKDFDLDRKLAEILDNDEKLIAEVKPIFLEVLEKKAFGCNTCLRAMTSVDNLLSNPKFVEVVYSLATLICTLAEIMSARVCRLGVQEWGPHVMYLAKNDYLSSKQVCYSLLGSACANPVITKANWTLNFPDIPKPDYVVPTSPPEGTEFAKVLHLSDVHMDIWYHAGSNAHCHEPICCRSIDGQPISHAWAAGKYGTVAYCDPPIYTFEALLEKLSTEKFDWILFTGDMPAHDVYNQTAEDNAYVIGLVNDLMYKYFPDTPVLNVLGNHGSAPVDQFIPPYMTEDEDPRPMAWLYDTLAEKWLKWLPESTRETIKTGAFWSWDFQPGFKIVCINSMYGQTADWYTSANNTDVHGMLQWMIDEFQDAEDRDMKVWLLTHHPGLTLDHYRQQYDEIISRYINVIVGWFNGHTHKDELRVVYDPTINGGTPVLTGFVAPSVTTYSDINMAYRVYYVDSKRENATFRVADYDTFYLNVSQAADTLDFTWEFEYNFKEAYNMTSLLPADFDTLLSQMLEDSSVAQEYVNYFYKSTSFHSCNDACAKNVVNKIQMTLAVAGSDGNIDKIIDERFDDDDSDDEDDDDDDDDDDSDSDDNSDTDSDSDSYEI